MGGFRFRRFHGLTPETETSCFYFWSCANGYRQDESEATEQLYREIAPTFVEDKDMVEAQQARLDELGEQGLVNIVSDTAWSCAASSSACWPMRRGRWRRSRSR